MIDILTILKTLADKRPIFHSEADFQHALAWEIHHHWPDCSMRLEFKPPHVGNRIYLDIWVDSSEVTLAIELKYKTRGLGAKIGTESFDLLNQSAQDIGRYDFCYDVQRLEQTVSKRKNIIGYCILLTNDGSYWRSPRDERTVDAMFRVHQGRTLTGDLSWGADASAGTMHGREEKITLTGKYVMSWQEYSAINAQHGEFKFLLVSVNGHNG